MTDHLLRALTVRQPWASLIVTGRKNVENRSWNTRYRGPLVIHAGLGIDKDGLTAHKSLLPDEVPHGCVLGVVDLLNVVRDSKSAWAEPGMYHWVLANPRALSRPLEASGKLGLWTPSPTLVHELQGEGVA